MSSEETKRFELKLSAPGKVILFGEYSVVFGKPAIAATLCLRTKLHFIETNSDFIHLTFSALELDKSFALKDIKECFEITLMDPWDAYLQQLAIGVVRLYEKTYGVFDLADAQKFSLITFFHVFLEILNFCNGFHLKINSELPVGSGVGSSASFSVVLSTAALFYELYSKKSESLDGLMKKNETGINTVGEKFREKISEIAFSCEKIFHGSPSGVDHNTILNGSMLQFVKLENCNKMTFITTTSIKILLINTNVPKSTKKLLGCVKELKENHPQVIECVLNAMEKVAESAIKDLATFNENNKLNQLETHFGDLVSLNHNLLRVLGVSHPTLEKIVSIAKKYNLNAKLTGGGGGGFGFIYLPSTVSISDILSLKKELIAVGFTPYEVTLGGPGLTIEELIF